MLYHFPLLPLVIFIAQLGLAYYFNQRLGQMDIRRARTAFFIYSAITGVTFAFIFSLYVSSTIFIAFLLASMTFGAMALYGSRTDQDLSKIGNISHMALLGVIIASLVNLVLYFFLPGVAAGIDYVLNYVVVAIFIALTAWDMQKLQRMTDQVARGEGPIGGQIGLEAISLYGAFMLYLDFINLFLRILRILGNRGRDER